MNRSRERAVETVRRRLLSRGWPRLQMSVILLATGAAGFLTSFALLSFGVPWMWLRYPIAILLAYCVFLLLLRLWLACQQPSDEALDLSLDLPSLDLGSARTQPAAPAFKFSGGGGDAGGGGAGWSWGGADAPSAVSRAQSSAGGGSWLDCFDADLEEGWLVVAALVAIVGGLVASLYVVYIAPVLLAEVLVDGLLVAGLYKRLKGVERRHWLRTAVRRTWVPVLLAVLLFTAAGYALQKAAPEARSIGGVWEHVAGG